MKVSVESLQVVRHITKSPIKTIKAFMKLYEFIDVELPSNVVEIIELYNLSRVVLSAKTHRELDLLCSSILDKKSAEWYFVATIREMFTKI